MDTLLPEHATACGYLVSAALEPQEALARVPGLVAADFHIEAMHGGLTNRVYKLSGDDATYVLRLDAQHTDAFGLDRSSEIEILGRASLAGLAPEIVHVDIDNGILLLRYIDGKVWTVADLSAAKNLESLASLLRRIHALPLSGKSLNASGVSHGYLDNLQSHAELHEFGVHCHAIIESIEPSSTYCCCHNDVVAENLIAGPNLMLLDWEYACDNEPLFDLASVIGYHGLEGAIADALLNAYAGGMTVELRERLSEQIRMYDAIHWLWLASRQAVSPSSSQARRLEALRQTLS